ncbi:phage tail protein [Streptomyces silaceus]|uniref:phage tail protein n=1 Tax=Streptomyces silaceus TaxID=545123 RepID=UPI001FCA1F82|nr:phage tail protein [Streptomyces silaceus]
MTITVRVNDATAAGFRDINGHLRTLDGRFAASAGSMTRSGQQLDKTFTGLKASLVNLAPALIPVAAQAAPIAAGLGAAGLAAAAFTAAVVPQISAMGEAAAAQKKYQDAVKASGVGSQAAAKAQAEVQRQLAAMPAATQRAAGSYMVLSDAFRTWSDQTASFTMRPVEQGLQITTALLPRLTPLARSASDQLTRLTTVAGGAIETPGFDHLTSTVQDFTDRTLDRATDKALHFMRVLSEGKAEGPLTEVMQYARAAGPEVKETLQALAETLLHVLDAAAQAGPGMLTIVNAFAQLVSAVPASLLATLLQVATAFKLIKLAGAGIGAAGAGLGTLTGRATALRAAFVAAGGGVAGMNAALGTLSTGGKAALAAGAVGALVLALHELSGAKPAVEVDALSSSLKTLTTTGKVTGTLKTNMKEMSESIAMVSKSGSENKLGQLVSDFGSWVGIAEGPGISTARKNVDAWDKSMANLVRSGNPKQAAEQFDLLKRAWKAGGGDMSQFKKHTNDYRDAIADAKFEAKMAAESMGLFGTQAQAAQAKLDGQKQAADGLRQSIQALNDVQRAGLGGMIGFEGAIDAAAKAAQANGQALSMTGGKLNLNSEAARTAASALNDLAAKTDEAAAQARESTGSWSAANDVYRRGRAELIRQADAMGLSRKQAVALADQILKVPSKTARIKMEKEDAEAGLRAFNAAVKKTPGSKSVTLKTLSKGAEQILESFGLKVKRLPNGKVTVTAANGKALSGIRDVQGALSRLPRSRNITITTFRKNTVRNITEYQTKYLSGRSQHDIVGATGGLFTGSAFKHGYADGGPVVGPGTGTSDDVFAPWLSNGEFVMKAAAVAKYGEKFMHLINEGRLDMPKFAKGGLTKAQKRAAAQRKSEHEARKDAWSDLTVSHFGQLAGGRLSEIRRGLGDPDSRSSLVSSLNQWRSTIMKSTHGGTERHLLRQLDSYGKALLRHEKSLSTVTKSLEKAKSKLDDLKNSASQLRDSVKNNVLSSANITKGGADGAPITTASVMAGLTRSRDQASAFASALKGLRKKGLSKDLINQIAEAGIDGGGLQTAGALLGASKSEIASMNKLQRQIGSSASSAGKTAADSMYGSAIRNQTAVVKALTSQQKRLEKAMDKLAHTMEKAIERAFRRKATGGIVGAAAVGGPRSGLTWVGEQGPELADLPVGSRVYSSPDSMRKAQAPWASMLNTPPRRAAAAARGTAPAPAGGERPIVIQVSFGTKELGELVIDPVRSAVRARGGLKATFGKVD